MSANGKAINPFVAIRAILRSDLSSAQVRTLLAILDKAGNGSGACTASYETLGAMTGRSRRRIISTIQPLIEKGWITAKPRVTNKGGDTSNSIRLGPGFFKAVNRQIELGKWISPGDEMVTPPVTIASLPQGRNGHSPGDDSVTQTSPLNVSFERGGEFAARTRARANRPPPLNFLPLESGIPASRK